MATDKTVSSLRGWAACEIPRPMRKAMEAQAAREKVYGGN